MALAPLSVASVSPSPHPLSLFVLSSILSVCFLCLAYATLTPFCLIEASSLLSSLFISPLVAFSLLFSHSLLSVAIPSLLLRTLFFVSRSISTRSERGRKKEYLIVPCFLSHKLTLFSLVVNIWQPRNYDPGVNDKVRASMRTRERVRLWLDVTYYNFAQSLVDNYGLLDCEARDENVLLSYFSTIDWRLSLRSQRATKLIEYYKKKNINMISKTMKHVWQEIFERTQYCPLNSNIKAQFYF